MTAYRKKAPFNDWWYWSDVLAKRLVTIAQMYNEFGEPQRAHDADATSRKLNEIFLGPARMGQKGVKTDEEKAALAKIEEEAIFAGVVIWQEMLNSLPFISEQLQSYLDIKWADINPQDEKKMQQMGNIDPRATELFWGPKGRYDEGIRSGHPKDGGLPGILLNYLLAERGSSSRSPSQYKTENSHNTFWGRSNDMNKAFSPPRGGM